jgi:hypothetical protein
MQEVAKLVQTKSKRAQKLKTRPETSAKEKTGER